MNREGHNDAVYFVGPEVETTPAFSLKTLFVVGVRSVTQMIELAEAYSCKHIYLGANRSFQKNKRWNEIIPLLLDKGFKVTLDYPADSHDFVVETLDPEITRHNNFIPMLSCQVAKVETFSKNLTIKIDDVDFKGTNSGVWCIVQRELLDSNRFTPWDEYGHDEIIVRDEAIKELRKNPSKRELIPSKEPVVEDEPKVKKPAPDPVPDVVRNALTKASVARTAILTSHVETQTDIVKEKTDTHDSLSISEDISVGIEENKN